MKKIVTLLLVTLCALFAFACDQPSNPPADIKFTVEIDNVQSGATVLDYMNYLQSEGEFTFTISGGMVTSFNGVSGASNQYWMLYTDDTNNSNADWGTITVGGKTYNSASCGAETLIEVDGCTYVWRLVTFE
ncbi:MAG: hypothetical protein IJY70_00905 [Clostridia bacterium]|nr:hypothetical protein [Clostridia bacterium]